MLPMLLLLVLLLLLLPSNLLKATKGKRSSLALLFTTDINFLGKKM